MQVRGSAGGVHRGGGGGGGARGRPPPPRPPRGGGGGGQEACRHGRALLSRGREGVILPLRAALPSLPASSPAPPPTRPLYHSPAQGVPPLLLLGPAQRLVQADGRRPDRLAQRRPPRHAVAAGRGVVLWGEGQVHLQGERGGGRRAGGGALAFGGGACRRLVCFCHCRCRWQPQAQAQTQPYSQLASPHTHTHTRAPPPLAPLRLQERGELVDHIEKRPDVMWRTGTQWSFRNEAKASALPVCLLFQLLWAEMCRRRVGMRGRSAPK